MIERFRLQKSYWLVKVMNTATGGEAIVLSMYNNYFDGTVCIGGSIYILKKPQNFTNIIFKLKTRPMLSYLAEYCLALMNMAAHLLYYKSELCIVKEICALNFLFFQSVKRLEISLFISVSLRSKIAVQIKQVLFIIVIPTKFFVYLLCTSQCEIRQPHPGHMWGLAQD